MSEVVYEQVAEFFLKEKPCRVLYAIENLKDSETYGSNISKVVDTTYAHTVKITSSLEEMGLIESEKNGRKKKLKLTDDGSELIEMLRPLMYDTFEFNSSSSLQQKYGGENLQ